ncbi:coenzyme F420-0:L-glutamate ligase [Dehalococcoidia bacterium]|nr:coenzyme F420-0:L-glutamate ligase [Dehalococcoidia bacterium]
MAAEIKIIGINGIPEIKTGMNLSELILQAARAQGSPIQERDILMVTQKIVSKAEGQLVDLSTVTPSHLAKEWAQTYDKDPRVIEVAFQESRRLSRMDKGVLVTETHHGFHCVNAGVDVSNVPGSEMVALLPRDPDGSAKKIRQDIHQATGFEVAVVITDTWGRPWRYGVTNVAIGASGIVPLEDYRGTTDVFGYELHGTAVAVVDELAAASELVMGKVDMVPVALVRGYPYVFSLGNVKDLLRESDNDLFR